MLKGKTRLVVMNSHLHFLRFFDRIIIMAVDSRGRASLSNADSSSVTVTVNTPAESKTSDSKAKRPVTTGYIAAIGRFDELAKQPQFASILTNTEQQLQGEDKQTAADTEPASPTSPQSVLPVRKSSERKEDAVTQNKSEAKTTKAERRAVGKIKGQSAVSGVESALYLSPACCRVGVHGIL